MLDLAVLVIRVLLLVGVAESAFAIPPWKSDSQNCSREGRFPVQEWAISGIEVGRSSLDDVKKTLGDAKQIRIGSDATSTRAICFSIDDQALIFESNLLSGAARIVSSITLIGGEEAPLFDACAKPAVDLRSHVSCVRSIGMGRVRFENAIGAAMCYRDDSGTEWGFLKTVEGEATMSGLEANFFRGELSWWRVYLSSSR